MQGFPETATISRAIAFADKDAVTRRQQCCGPATAGELGSGPGEMLRNRHVPRWRQSQSP